MTREIRHFAVLKLCLSCALSLGVCIPWASAELVTFSFTAVLDAGTGTSLPLPVGQQVSGHYTFDLNSPVTFLGGANLFTYYAGAIKSFSVTLAGFGTGNGVTGDIYLGDPVATTGSYNFLSDFYQAAAEMTGITLPTSFGNQYLDSAILRMQDLDLEGLDSETLSAVPPDLNYFLDNAAPPYPHDTAEILLGFGTPAGGYGHTPFRLTSLVAVPEPTTAITALLAFAGCFHRVRRTTKLANY